MTSRKLLRVGDIAEAMGVSRSRVYQLVETGQIPAIRLGRSLFVPEEAWERWLIDQAQGAMRGVCRGAEKPESGVACAGDQDPGAPAEGSDEGSGWAR